MSRSVGDYVADMAKRHGGSYAKTPSDELAEVVTALSGDDIQSDETKDLIVALRRAGVIDGPEMVSILGNYLDELRR